MRARLERCVTPLLAATGLLPVMILLACGNDLPALVLWPLIYLASACLCVQLKGKVRLACAIVLAVGMLAGCGAWFARCREPIVLLTGLVCAALLLATLPQRQETTHAAVMGGLALHVLAQIFFNMLNEEIRVQVYAPAHGPMLISLMVFLAAALLTLNRFSLASAMPGGRAVPATIRRRNRLLTWLMLLGAVLLALIPALGRLLDAVWAWLRHAVSAVILWLFSLQFRQETAGGQGGGEMGMGGLGEAEPPSALAVWLEKILLVLTAVAVVVLAVLAARILWKKLRILLRWLWQRLQGYAAVATEDYVDEVQDTRTQGEERFSLARLLKRRPTAREISALPPRERIRARYGLARGKHPEWTDSHTARETLGSDSASIYERARYSTHEVTEQDAEKFMS